SGQGGERQGRDELRPGGGQDHPHRHVRLTHQPDQLERLVGGDAAADDQQDSAFSGQGALLTARGRNLATAPGSVDSRCVSGLSKARYSVNDSAGISKWEVVMRDAWHGVLGAAVLALAACDNGPSAVETRDRTGEARTASLP